MRLLLMVTLCALFLQAQSILVINSSSKVKKYNETLQAFSKVYTKPFKTIDLSTMSESDIKEYIYDEYPDVIYAIGAKAYQYANKYIPEKRIYFSSIINFKRLVKNPQHFGVSSELHTTMQLTLIKSVFNQIKTIGVVYSKYTQDIVDSFSASAQELGINIVAQKIDEELVKSPDFFNILDKTQALIIIPDPIFLSSESAVINMFKYAKKEKKPIFAYHQLFIKYGASLVISVDNPTIGRQVASMIKNAQNEQNKRVHYPAGTKVVFNKKIVLEMGINYSPNVSLIVNETME